MMKFLLSLPGQVVHANLRGADTAWLLTGTKGSDRPSQICVNLLLGLFSSVLTSPCFRVSVVSPSPFPA
jgi:hypothetical protein